MAELKRTLGLTECIFFGVGSILGAGIYTLIGKVAGLSGNFIWLSFLIAAGSALFTAFSYAELSAAFPKAGGLFFVIYAALPYLGEVNYVKPPAQGYNGILAASALAFFAYIGFEEIVKLAEETKAPEKNIPRALFIASAIVIVIYSLVAIGAVSVIPYQELGKSASPLADVIGKDYGQTGVIIISVIALFATSNTILSNMIGSSRVLLNISKETKALKLFSYVSPKRKAPLAALVLILLLMLGFALIGNIEIIARIATVFIFITFIVVNLSVIVLRIRQKEILRPYRIPLNIKNIPLVSVLGILTTLVLLGYTIQGLYFSSFFTTLFPSASACSR
jgi:APA family basic amino acid/polyamine antiporter